MDSYPEEQKTEKLQRFDLIKKLCYIEMCLLNIIDFLSNNYNLMINRSFNRKENEDQPV